MRLYLILLLGILWLPMNALCEQALPTEVIETVSGPVALYMVGHGTLMIGYNRKTIHIDPWTRLADYDQMPKADLILVTHGHQDHFDSQAITKIRTKDTFIIVSKVLKDAVDDTIVMENGDVRKIDGIVIEAVPAYNILHMRSENTPYHPKGEGNGYILTFGDKRIYIAGDTENIPEMKALKTIDVAFLPMNLPYTMTPEMVAEAAKAFKPKILYPYHYGMENLEAAAKLKQKELERFMADEPAVEVRFPIIRK